MSTANTITVGSAPTAPEIKVSPSPVNPRTEVVALLSGPQQAYRVLDSEPSGDATGLKDERPVDPSLSGTVTTATTRRTTTTTTSAPPQSSTEEESGTTAASVIKDNALSDEQRYAYHLAVHEGRSIFITGGAGTGKSHLLRTIVSAMPLSSTFVTATTGIAALNLSGTTLHSFVGCGIPGPRATPARVLSTVRSKNRCVRNWRLCRALIIDEVSMLEASFFDLIDYIARHVRNRPDEPFGGIQLILSGDFLQLPPVVRERRSNSVLFCFESKTWSRVNPKICLLSTPFRQRDLRFFKILNEMRFGELRPCSVALLHSIDTSNRLHFVRRGDPAGASEAEKEQKKVALSRKRKRDDSAIVLDALGTNFAVPSSGDNDSTAVPVCGSTFSDPPARPGERHTQLELVDGMGRGINAPFDGYTILRSTRAEVDEQNERFFSQLDTEIFTYVGFHTGASVYPAHHLSEVVQLRKGCRVMLIKNFDMQARVVNGSAGTVTGFVSYEKGYRFLNPGISASDAREICVGRGRDVERHHTMLPIVAFDSRNRAGQTYVDEIVVEPQEWVEMEGDCKKSRSVQIPLVLAYAITIHKSQGMSLTQVDIDFAKVFEAGQSYVALSRCTDLKRVRLHGFNAHFVSANSTALAYYKALALQQQRLEWQRRHTPSVVAAAEDVEARSCTPYGYVLPNEAGVVRSFGEEDFSHGFFESNDGGEGGGDDDDDAKNEDEEVDGAGGRVGYNNTQHRDGKAERRPVDRLHLHPPRPLESGDDGVWVNESQRLDDLRRRITPLLDMADAVKRLVLREMLPLPKVRNCRLVMDIDALFHLVTGPESATAFDVLFGAQENMMRVPLCVQQLIEEAAAYRSASSSMTPSATPVQPLTPSRTAVQHPPLQSAAALDIIGEDNGPDVAMLAASDVAAEALAVMARAKQEFVLDIQRPEQVAVLPEPKKDWLRFADVLPLLLRRQSPKRATEPVMVDAARGGSLGVSAEEVETSRELNFLLNRDPREAMQHRAIVEYALFLLATFGQNVAVCTDSIVLAAYALAWGLRVVSVEYLF
jgi:ATP-dependent DNA helicase PIF1